MLRIGLIVFILMILLLTVAVAGGQLLVSQDGTGGFRTIQGAIDAAHYGDLIYVNPGVYEEHVFLKDGITLVGAGPALTRIRYGYGFEEVLTARNMSSGRVEGFTIEREASVLEGPAVVIDSASIAIVDCIVTGAGEWGIEIRDETSRPSLERVQITDNVSHGIWAYAGARPRIVNCEITKNGGDGILLTGDASASLVGVRIADNAESGIALADAAAVSIDGSYVGENCLWGIELADRSSASVIGTDLAGNDEGGIRLADRSDLKISGSRLTGGKEGIEAGGSSRVSLIDCTIGHAQGTGISLAKQAGGEIEGTEIIGCGSDGILIDASTTVSIDHATIVQNGGSGLRIASGTVLTSNSIIAYNGACGIRYEPSGGEGGKFVSSHNDLFGNGTDYSGISRRPSDISAPPRFVNLAGGDLSLRPGSPCIGAGEGGRTIGAHPDPDGEPGIIVELAPAYPDLFGFDLSAYLRFSTKPFHLEEMRLTAARKGRSGSFSLTGSPLNGGWLQGDGSLSLFAVLLPTGEGELAASCGFAGVLDGVESWGSAWGEGRLTADRYGFAGSFSLAFPGYSSTSIAFTLGGKTKVFTSVHFTALTSDSLSIGAAADLGAILLRGEVSLIPDRILALSLSKMGEGWEGSLNATVYLDHSGNWSGSLGFRLPDEGVAIGLNASFSILKLASGSVSLKLGSDAGRMEAELGITEEGKARLSLRFEADLALLFSPPPDIPPLPSFSVYPLEPEAGEPVEFDASESRDPDGRIVEYWWDFGDGELGMGERGEHRYAAAGEYLVTLSVTDDDGVPASTGRRITVFPADTAPVASFVWAPVSPGGTPLDRPVREGDSVRLDASGSYDPDGEIVEYDWDLQSDGEFEIVGPDPIITVPPFASGSHPVTLRVIDDDKRSSAVMHAIIVESPAPPKAEFTFTPSSPSLLDPVRFTDRSVDADGTIIAWEWDFGDGRTSREQSPIHRYSEVGRYRIRLTVTDDDGQTATTEVTLRVRRIPEVVPVASVWALIIGISDYEEVKDLAFGRRDAEALSHWALEAGIPPDHIRLLTDREGRLPGNDAVVSEPASLVNVREGFGWLRRMARRDDLVLIYFSGHGYQGLDDGADEADGVDEFFVLYDTRAGAVDDTALRDDEFGRFLDRLESDHVLVLFDGCYSGGLGRSLAGGHRPTTSSPDIFSDLALEGRLILSAAAEGQEAFESEGLGHGVFTHFILEGLEGNADLNGDSQITAWELYEYVAREVPGYVRAERGEEQTPQITGEGDVRVVVAGLRRPPQAGVSFLPALPFAHGPVRFTDETLSDGGILSRMWDFGDGQTSSEVSPLHAYTEEGVYSVVLTVTDTAGRVATASAKVAVGPAGYVISVDRVRRRGIVSLGERNGLRVGDILYTSGTRIEIVELIGGERAAFEPTGDGPLPEVGDPIAPADEP